MISFFRSFILPRLPHLAWLISVPWLVFVAIFRSHRCTSRGPCFNGTSGVIAIEAGSRGWDSIEFKELYQSAAEYFGCSGVVKLVVRQEVDYLEQIRVVLAKNRITHYLYDPRTGSQNWSQAIWQSLKVATLLTRNNIVPIILLTDFAVRRWRVQSAIVSSLRGVVVIFMSPRSVAPIFPHRRLLGPSLMPLSEKMLRQLGEWIRHRPENLPPKAIFTGSMYEPRTTILAAIEAGVKAKGGVFDCLGRSIGTARTPDDEYWTRLINADIVFTTSCQMQQPGTDWASIPHFLYRYLEVIASGTLLIAEDVPAVRRYFTPGEHFVTYESIDDGVDKIIFFLNNHDQRRRIACEGKRRADFLVHSRTFWMTIDSTLGKDGLF